MWLRLTLLCLFLVVQTSFPGKTGETMRQFYGPPVSETFLVRPGLVVSASYCKKGRQVCELFISPQKPTTLVKSANQTKAIDSKLLTEIINELVPENERGRGISGDFLNIRCLPSDDCAGTGSNWEKISIYRNGGSNDEHYATIQWHGADCASQTAQ